MPIRPRTLAACAFAVASGVATISHATNYSLWVNGRGGGGQLGNYADFTYWGPGDVDAGVNKKSVNWDGYSHISDQNYLVRNALDCYCTGANWCYVAAHSAGDLMMGYSLALYGGSSRHVKKPKPGADGSCADSGGATQTGWNIKWVDIAAGAGGGSELADVGDWALSEPLVSDLKTTTARALYDHSETRSNWFYMYAGAKGTLYSAVLPGQDDEVVAYHSAGGVSGASGGAYCNPSDWFCNDLTLGTDPVEGGRPKWACHAVNFRDSAEKYNHYTKSNWAGVVSLVRQDMAANAQGAPLSEAGRAERTDALALWQQRLQRARQTLAGYQASTRYPDGSRPAAEHADQWQTHQPITNDLPLRLPGGDVTPGLRVHTTQERVFAGARDTVALTVTLTDDDGRVLPLRILRSVAHGPLAGAPGQPLPAAPVVTQPFVDDGSLGDAQANDGTFTARLAPAAEGFEQFAGLIRTELTLQSGDTPGYVAFDVVYAPGTPATWSGPVRETLADGALDLDLAIDVAQPGRFVVSGRVDDADGRPFAYVGFNDELGAGAQQVRLTIAGRLVRDGKPTFPLVLHDVEAFRLEPDAYPDRTLMAPRDGKVWTTRAYALALFSDATFASDETARHVAEYRRDVADAQRQVDRLTASLGR